jgi:hypothetical protein
VFVQDVTARKFGKKADEFPYIMLFFRESVLFFHKREIEHIRRGYYPSRTV